MIRLSDVKVRPQYRWRVRQRLMVLHFARLHGPTAAAGRCGVSARTIRRWRVRWRQDAVQGLVPRPKNSRACYRLRRHNAIAALAVAHRRPGQS
jgi:transposase